MRPFFFYAVIALLWMPAAKAADTGNATYQVNAIVFALHQPGPAGHEQWTQEKVLPLRGLGRAVAPVGGLTPDSPLNAALARLATDARYQVLAVVNWIQPGVDRAQAVPMRLQDARGSLDGTIIVYRLQYLHSDLDLAYVPGGQVAGTPAEPVAVAGPGLLNSVPPIAVPSPQASPNEGGNPVVYRLIERRRVRAGKIEYFDHPRFGVLLSITPLKPTP